MLRGEGQASSSWRGDSSLIPSTGPWAALGDTCSHGLTLSWIKPQISCLSFGVNPDKSLWGGLRSIHLFIHHLWIKDPIPCLRNLTLFSQPTVIFGVSANFSLFAVPTHLPFLLHFPLPSPCLGGWHLPSVASGFLVCGIQAGLSQWRALPGWRVTAGLLSLPAGHWGSGQYLHLLDGNSCSTLVPVLMVPSALGMEHSGFSLRLTSGRFTMLFIPYPHLTSVSSPFIEVSLNIRVNSLSWQNSDQPTILKFLHYSPTDSRWAH